MPHSCKLHPQGDGDGKGGVTVAPGLAQGEGGAGGDRPPGRPGTLIQQPGWESLRASYPEGQPPGTGFGRTGEQKVPPGPKRPSLDRDQKRW